MIVRTEWASLTDNTKRIKSGMVKKKADLFTKFQNKTKALKSLVCENSEKVKYKNPHKEHKKLIELILRDNPRRKNKQDTRIV